MIKASSQQPKQVTKPGYPVAAHKPNSSCFHIWTKQGTSYQTLQHVGDHFLTAGALFMRNLFLHAKWLNCIVTGKFCNVWANKSIENARNDSTIRNGWFTINNALTHTAPSMQQISADKNTFVVPYSPYSPKLAPCDFFLFTKIKQQLWGWHFWDAPEIHDCQHMPRNSVPAWTEMLILMHKLRRRLLWNVSMYFIIKSVHITCKVCRRYSWKIQTATVYLKQNLPTCQIWFFIHTVEVIRVWGCSTSTSSVTNHGVMLRPCKYTQTVPIKWGIPGHKFVKSLDNITLLITYSFYNSKKQLKNRNKTTIQLQTSFTWNFNFRTFYEELLKWYTIT